MSEIKLQDPLRNSLDDLIEQAQQDLELERKRQEAIITSEEPDKVLSGLSKVEKQIENEPVEVQRSVLDKAYNPGYFDRGDLKQKDISPIKNQQEKRQPFSEALVNDLASGTADLLASITSAPGFIYELKTLPRKMFSEATGLEFLDPTVGAKALTNNPVTRYFNDVATHFEEENTRYDQGITDYLRQGNIVDALGLTASSIVKSLPYTASIIAGGAYGIPAKVILPVVATVTGGGKSATLIEEMPEFSDERRILNSLIDGLAEGGFEAFGSAGIGRQLKRISGDLTQTLGRKKGNEVLKETIKNTFQDKASRYIMLKSANQEGWEEFATTVVQNLNAQLTGEDPDRELFEGAVDSYIVGAGSGGALSAPTAVQVRNQRKRIEKSKGKVLEALESGQLRELSDQEITDFASSLTPEERMEVGIGEDGKFEIGSDLGKEVVRRNLDMDKFPETEKEIREANARLNVKERQLEGTDFTGALISKVEELTNIEVEREYLGKTLADEAEQQGWTEAETKQVLKEHGLDENSDPSEVDLTGTSFGGSIKISTAGTPERMAQEYVAVQEEMAEEYYKAEQQNNSNFDNEIEQERKAYHESTGEQDTGESNIEWFSTKAIHFATQGKVHESIGAKLRDIFKRFIDTSKQILKDAIKLRRAIKEGKVPKSLVSKLKEATDFKTVGKKVDQAKKIKKLKPKNTFRISKNFNFQNLSTVPGYTLSGTSDFKAGTKIKSIVRGKDMINTSSNTPPDNAIYELKKINIKKDPIIFGDKTFSSVTRDDFLDDDYDGYQTRTFEDIKQRMEKGGMESMEPLIFDNFYHSDELEMIDGHHRAIIANELGWDEIYAYVRKPDQAKKIKQVAKAEGRKATPDGGVTYRISEVGKVDPVGVFVIGADMVARDLDGKLNPFGLRYTENFQGFQLSKAGATKLVKNGKKGFNTVAVIAYDKIKESQVANPSFQNRVKEKLVEAIGKRRLNKLLKENNDDVKKVSGIVNKEIQEANKNKAKKDKKEKINMEAIALDNAEPDSPQLRRKIIYVGTLKEIRTGKDRIRKHDVYPAEQIFDTLVELKEPIPIDDLVADLPDTDFRKKGWGMMVTQTNFMMTADESNIAQELIKMGQEGKDVFTGTPNPDYQFYSSETDQTLTVKEAISKSGDEKEFKSRQFVSQLDEQLGLGTATRGSVGISEKYGNESAIVTRFFGKQKQELLEYRGAWTGLMFDQKDVTNFIGDDNGKHSLLKITIDKTNLIYLNEVMQNNGILSQTIRIRGNKQDILLWDKGDINTKLVHAIAEDYNAKEYTKQKGEFKSLTNESDRKEARKAFIKIIQDYQGKTDIDIPKAFTKFLPDFYKRKSDQEQLLKQLKAKPKATYRITPTFYSQADRVVTDKFPPTMKSQSVENFLKKNQVKPEEIEWLDLESLLKGKLKITKEELQEWIQANKIDVQDVTFGQYKEDPKAKKQLIKLYEKRSQELGWFVNQTTKIKIKGYEDKIVDRFKLNQVVITGEGASTKITENLYDGKINPIGYFNNKNYEVYGGVQNSLEYTHRLNSLYNLEKEINELEFKEAKMREKKDTEYESYQLPGEKEDYRELLLILPPRPMTFEEFDADARSIGLTDQQAIKNQYVDYLKDPGKDISKDKNFKTGHFKQSNILAHVRFNTRISPTGERILFIEELQSDWHTKGREKGYKGKPYVRKYSKKESQKIIKDTVVGIKEIGKESKLDNFAPALREYELNSQAYEMTKMYTSNIARIAVNQAYTDIRLPSKLRERVFALSNQMGNLEEDKALASQDRKKTSLQVPNAPFKGNGWIELIMKRMLRHASDNNFDRIAWTTSNQQIDRWRNDLRQNVDQIQWQKNILGIKSLRQFTVEQEQIDGMKIQNNIALEMYNQYVEEETEAQRGMVSTVIINGLKNKESRFNQTIPLEGETTINGQKVTLEGLLGKQMATQIRNDKKRTGIIEGDDLTIGGQGFKVVYDFAISKILNKMGKKFGAKVDQVNMPMEKGTIPYDQWVKGVKDMVDNAQPSIKITRKMKESALKGQPTFRLSKMSSTDEVLESSSFKKWFKGSKVKDKDGKPLVVYHGSEKDFDKFKVPSALYKGKEILDGVYFITNPDKASDYAQQFTRTGEYRRNQIYPVFLSIQNPYKSIQGEDTWGMVSELKKKGYDGVVTETNQGIVYKAFYPTQVKSVFNKGTFNPNDPRISFRLSPKNIVTPLAKVYQEQKGNKKSYTKKDWEQDLARLGYDEDMIKSAMDMFGIIRMKQIDTTDPTPIEKELKKLQEREIKKSEIKSRIKRAYRLGATEKEKEITKLQKIVTNYARENLPKGLYQKSEVTGILAKVRDAKRFRELGTAMERIDRVIDKVSKRGALAKWNKTIKKKAVVKKVGGIGRGKVGADVQEIVNQIRDIHKKSPVEIENKIDVLTQIMEASEDGEATDSQALEINILLQYGSMKNKTPQEIIEATEKFDTLVTQGRMQIMEEQMAYSERMSNVRQEILDVITGGAGAQTQAGAQKLGLKDQGIIKEIVESLSGFETQQQSLEYLFDKLSRLDKTSKPLQSFINNYFMPQIRQARLAEYNGVVEMHKLMRENAERIFKVKDTIFDKALTKLFNKNSIETITITHRDGAEGEMTSSDLTYNQAYKKWMELKDPTLYKTFEKMGWDIQKTKNQIEQQLPKEVLAWAEWQLYEFYPMYYHRVNETFRSRFYVNMPMNAMYSPIARRIGAKADEGDDTLNKSKSPMGSMSSAGSLKGRVSNTEELAWIDGDNTLMKHITEMEHFIHYTNVMRELRSVFMSRDVSRSVQDFHGKNISRTLNKFMDDIARGGVDRAMHLEWADKWRAKVTRATIGLNEVVFIKQLTSIPAYWGDMPITSWHKEVLMSIGAFEFKKAYRTLSKSDMIKMRYDKGFERDMVLALNNIKPGKMMTGSDWLNNVAFFLTKMGDKTAIFLGGWPLYKYEYKKALKEGKTKKEAEDIAMKKFEASTKRAQQASDPEDLSDFQRMGSAWKFFTMYMTSPNQYYRMSAGGVRNIYYGRGTKAENLRRIFVGWFLLPQLFTFVANGFEIDEDEQLISLLTGPFVGLMFVGQGIEHSIRMAFGKEYRSGSVALLDIFNDFGRMFKKMFNGKEFDTKKILSIIDDFLKGSSKAPLVGGFPYAPVKRSIASKMKVIKGESDNPIREAVGFKFKKKKKKPKRVTAEPTFSN